MFTLSVNPPATADIGNASLAEVPSDQVKLGSDALQPETR
jgi:hypothetical protein